VPEANSSTEYADNFWQGWVSEARCAIEALHAAEARRSLLGDPVSLEPVTLSSP
jgi:hypothetical protein